MMMIRLWFLDSENDYVWWLSWFYGMASLMQLLMWGEKYQPWLRLRLSMSSCSRVHVHDQDRHYAFHFVPMHAIYGTTAKGWKALRISWSWWLVIPTIDLVATIAWHSDIRAVILSHTIHLFLKALGLTYKALHLYILMLFSRKCDIMSAETVISNHLPCKFQVSFPKGSEAKTPNEQQRSLQNLRNQGGLLPFYVRYLFFVSYGVSLCQLK